MNGNSRKLMTSLAALVALLALIFPMVMFADTLSTTLEDSLGNNTKTLSLGTITKRSDGTDATATGTVPLAVACSGRKHGSGAVPFTVSTALNTGSKGTTSELVATPNLTLPSTWPTDGIECPNTTTEAAGQAAIGVSIPADAATGDRSIKVSLRSSDDDVNNIVNFDVTYTVANPVVTQPTDTSAPTITPKVEGELGTNSWYVGDVTVSWTVTDNESAISSSTGCGQTIISVDTAGTTLKCTATSAGGTSSHEIVIKRDTVAPNAPTASATKTDGTAYTSGSWSNQDVTVSFASNGDAGTVQSGGVSCTSSSTVSTETAGQTVSGTCIDAAGNTSSAASVTVQLDKTAPNAPTASATKTDGTAYTSGSWSNQDVTVSFASNGDAGTVQSGGVSCTSSSTVSTETAGQTVSGTCIDAAGNTSSAASVTVQLDKTAPNAPTASATKTDGTAYTSGSWSNQDVTVSFASNGDAGTVQSGVTCSSDRVISTETAGQTVSGTCTDAAGNVSASSNSITVKLDKTAPALTPSVSPNPVLLNGTATASAGASDSLSQLASSSCGPVTTSTVGANSVTCQATDNAGNTASASANYTVNYKTCLLYDPSRAVKLGAVYPIKIQLCDANGVNYSSSSIVVNATGLVKKDSTAGTVSDAGNANPDNNFRYDANLGGYIYNLSTKGLSTGTWSVNFDAGTSKGSANFDVK